MYRYIHVIFCLKCHVVGLHGVLGTSLIFIYIDCCHIVELLIEGGAKGIINTYNIVILFVVGLHGEGRASLGG